VESSKKSEPELARVRGGARAVDVEDWLFFGGEKWAASIASSSLRRDTLMSSSSSSK